MTQPAIYPPRGVRERSDPFIGAVAISYGGGDQDVTVPARGLYISTGGNLSVEMLDGTTATFTGLLVGNVYWVCVRKIFQVGSSAAGLVLY